MPSIMSPNVHLSNHHVFERYQIHGSDLHLYQVDNTIELRNHLNEIHDYHHMKNGQFPIFHISFERQQLSGNEEVLYTCGLVIAVRPSSRVLTNCVSGWVLNSCIGLRGSASCLVFIMN